MTNAVQLIEFFLMPVEDREASLLAGGYRTKDVEYIRITNPKGLDVSEREVTPEIINQYKKHYDAFKSNLTVSVDGVRVKETALFSPAEIKNLESCSVQTLQQLVEMSESGIAALGMGGRAMKIRAETYLNNMNSTGKIVQEILDLKKKLESKDAKIQELEEVISSLKTQKKTKEAA